jgi:hypothetical protein
MGAYAEGDKVLFKGSNLWSIGTVVGRDETGDYYVSWDHTGIRDYYRYSQLQKVED